MIDKNNSNDLNPLETKEWLEALDNVVYYFGKERACFLVEKINYVAQKMGVVTSIQPMPYCNTLTTDIAYPGDLTIELRIDAINRWNAMIMVIRATKVAESLGGHISTACSVSRLYEVGQNHHFLASTEDQLGDLVFFQGHATEINYARGLLEGRLTTEQLDKFRQESDGQGLSSYPHPWLMKDFWQFPTVSMGLGIIQAIYQAYLMRYLHQRQFIDETNRHIWYFSGDGEMDEPESKGALTIAARHQLDNLTLVINCNLQRLDGPVFANGSIVRELEGLFLGCNWHVIKVIWGNLWNDVFERDDQDLILQRMRQMVDGEFQNYTAKDGGYSREHFFNTPQLKELVAHLDDQQIAELFHQGLGGHDMVKIHSAFVRAKELKGKPTVILSQAIKGFGLGDTAQSRNIAHNVKKIAFDELKLIRERLHIPIDDEALTELPYYVPDADSCEAQYVQRQRRLLNGFVPKRRLESSKSLTIPPLEEFASLLKNSGQRQISNTMAFVRALMTLMKNKQVGTHVVPIVPDESRTFGMEGMFRQFGIHSCQEPAYTPVDAEQLMYYKQSTQGQLIEEGINEAGAMSAWIAAATSYSNHDTPLIPFYVYYSMFGFQRIGDLAWAAADICARGFLIGATAGRTTLSGEGLQHNDGHSHILSSVIPTCISYDPTYSYELAVIIQHGLERMFVNKENLFYYLTVTTENYYHPDMPQEVEEGIIKGMYCLKKSEQEHPLQVQLLGSGTILREAEEAAKLLESDYEINANVWSVTSFTELRRDGLKVARWNQLHPDDKPKLSFVEQMLATQMGPVIAASDYICAFADQIRQWIKKPYITLGTDGFGRSDTREKLRHFFEIDRYFIVVAALNALSQQQKISPTVVKKAMKEYGISPNKIDPATT